MSADDLKAAIERFEQAVLGCLIEDSDEGKRARGAEYIAAHQALTATAAAIWREGAQWAAVELKAIDRVENQWVTDEDNPYLKSAPEQPSCICDGGAYELRRQPFIVNVQCAVHGVLATAEGQVPLYNPDGSPRTNDEIRAHAADIRAGEEAADEWEYGFYDSESQATIWWYVFGLPFKTAEQARHAGVKSVYGQAVIVRRHPGQTNWEHVAEEES